MILVFAGTNVACKKLRKTRRCPQKMNENRLGCGLGKGFGAKKVCGKKIF
jgi:hypothetical protein